MFRKYLFDVECLIRDGESLFSLHFLDFPIFASDKFEAYYACSRAVSCFFTNNSDCAFVVSRLECDDFD